MWTYQQSTGHLTDPHGALCATGYAGHGEGKNNPDLQSVPNVGPLPQGTYQINGPIDTANHGPYVLRLMPSPTNEMFGRAGFLIHGDSISAPGTASQGCICVARAVREAIWTSGDHDLTVVA